MEEFEKFIKWMRENALPLLITVVVTNFLGVYAIIMLAILLVIIG